MVISIYGNIKGIEIFNSKQIHWEDQNTSAKLGLFISMKPDVIGESKHRCLLKKSDDVIIEFRVREAKD